MYAGENLGLNKQCPATPQTVTSINGVLPDSDGNFYIIGANCVSLTPIEYGLSLQDSCGQPCIGCSEMGTVTDRLVSLETDLLTTRDYVTSLQTLLTQLSTLVNYQCNCEQK